jgi:Spy/CpxP family protein refolding chaperone
MRVWILATVVGCFAAGMSAGLAIPGVLAACSGEAGGNEDETYVRQVAEKYGLTPYQQKQLRAVLQRQSEEEREVFRTAAELPRAVVEARESVHRKASERMRSLLDERQRVAYDRDAQHQGN